MTQPRAQQINNPQLVWVKEDSSYGYAGAYEVVKAIAKSSGSYFENSTGKTLIINGVTVTPDTRTLNSNPYTTSALLAQAIKDKTELTSIVEASLDEEGKLVITAKDITTTITLGGNYDYFMFSGTTFAPTPKATGIVTKVNGADGGLAYITDSSGTKVTTGNPVVYRISDTEFTVGNIPDQAVFARTISSNSRAYRYKAKVSKKIRSVGVSYNQLNQKGFRLDYEDTLSGVSGSATVLVNATPTNADGVVIIINEAIDEATKCKTAAVISSVLSDPLPSLGTGTITFQFDNSTQNYTVQFSNQASIEDVRDLIEDAVNGFPNQSLNLGTCEIVNGRLVIKSKKTDYTGQVKITSIDENVSQILGFSPIHVKAWKPCRNLAANATGELEITFPHPAFRFKFVETTGDGLAKYGFWDEACNASGTWVGTENREITYDLADSGLTESNIQRKVSAFLKYGDIPEDAEFDDQDYHLSALLSRFDAKTNRGSGNAFKAVRTNALGEIDSQFLPLNLRSLSSKNVLENLTVDDHLFIRKSNTLSGYVPLVVQRTNNITSDLTQWKKWDANTTSGAETILALVDQNGILKTSGISGINDGPLSILSKSTTDVGSSFTNSLRLNNASGTTTIIGARGDTSYDPASNLFVDHKRIYLGRATGTPDTSVDIMGNATIKNGLYVRKEIDDAFIPLVVQRLSADTSDLTQWKRDGTPEQILAKIDRDGNAEFNSITVRTSSQDLTSVGGAELYYTSDPEDGSPDLDIKFKRRKDDLGHAHWKSWQSRWWLEFGDEETWTTEAYFYKPPGVAIRKVKTYHHINWELNDFANAPKVSMKVYRTAFNTNNGWDGNLPGNYQERTPSSLYWNEEFTLETPLSEDNFNEFMLYKVVIVVHSGNMDASDVDDYDFYGHIIEYRSINGAQVIPVTEPQGSFD